MGADDAGESNADEVVEKAEDPGYDEDSGYQDEAVRV
jgi:hypothetical protein